MHITVDCSANINKRCCGFTMSLAEISELQNTSRQAVRDVIVRCGDKLLDFEQKLGLVEKIKKVASDFEANIETGNYNKEQIGRLNLILKEIKEI